MAVWFSLQIFRKGTKRVRIFSISCAYSSSVYSNFLKVRPGIKSVGVTYDGKTSGKTTVTCDYGKFKPLGTKLFPTDITLKLKTGAVKNADKMSVNISINNLDTSDDWDTFTTVSGKYKQVDVQDVVKRLMKM